MTSKRKIGIFSGSFNPIHIGHLALANYICEFEDIDEVWFMVTPHNPIKQTSELMNDEFRLELVKLSIEGYHKFKASDFEFKLPKPSYTINTLNELRKHYPENDFCLIIGSDNWHLFPRWKQWEDIIAHYSIMIYPRPGYDIDESTLPDSVKLSKAPIFDISSTFIRNALKKGKDIRYLLHPNAYKTIEEWL